MDFKTFKKDVDKYRTKIGKITLTKEQREFLLLCREGEDPVPFRKMSVLWDELGWGKLSRAGIQERYEKIKAGKL